MGRRKSIRLPRGLLNKSPWLFIVLAIVVAVWQMLPGDRPETTGKGEGEPAVLTKVVDGDTVWVRLNGRRESIRLLGIDTPETKNSPRLVARAAQMKRSATAEARMGRTAREYLARMLPSGSTVRLLYDHRQGARDRHGRLLAYLVNEEGVLVNREMVTGGMARVYRRYKFQYRDQWISLEDQARRGAVGLWSRGGP